MRYFDRIGRGRGMIRRSSDLPSAVGARRATSTIVQTLRDSVTPTFGLVRRTRSRLPRRRWTDGNEECSLSLRSRLAHENALSSNRGRVAEARGTKGESRTGPAGPELRTVSFAGLRFGHFSPLTSRLHATITIDNSHQAHSRRARLRHSTAPLSVFRPLRSYRDTQGVNAVSLPLATH